MKKLFAILLFCCSCAFGQGVYETLLGLVPTAPSGGGSSASSLTTNLLAYWRLEETSDGSSAAVNRADATGNGYTLTDNSRTPSITGYVGTGAYIRDNSGEYLSSTDNAFDLSSGSFSISFWVNFHADRADYVASKYATADASREWSFTRDGNAAKQLTFRAGTNGLSAGMVYCTTTYAIPSNTWVFVCAVRDFSAGKMYLVTSSNSILADLKTNTLPAIYSGAASGPLEVGRLSAVAGMIGALDEFAIWNRALSFAEITNLFSCATNQITYPWTGQP